MEKFEKIAEILDISILKVKVILGLPLRECQALSAEKARDIFMGARDEEEKYSALLKWMTLTSSWDEALKAYQSVERESDEEIIALRRMVELITNFDQALTTFTEADAVIADLGEEYDPVYATFYDQSLASALTLCQNFEEARQLWDLDVLGDEDRVLIFPVWLNVCQTSDNFEEMLTEFSDEDSEENKVKIEMINQRWQELFSERINSAKSFEACAEAYATCPPEQELKNGAVKKWLQHCYSVDEVESVYEGIYTEDYSSEMEKDIVKKFYQVMVGY